jgi:protein-S-isoprenylcysteine O-methyltransferase Ste14
MFLRSDEPSPGSKNAARTIAVIPAWTALVVVVVLNGVVAGHLVAGDSSPTWIWIQLLGIGVLIFAIFGVVFLTRKMRGLVRESAADE